jgi:hypothetical protein
MVETPLKEYMPVAPLLSRPLGTLVLQRARTIRSRPNRDEQIKSLMTRLPPPFLAQKKEKESVSKPVNRL